MLFNIYSTNFTSGINKLKYKGEIYLSKNINKIQSIIRNKKYHVGVIIIAVIVISTLIVTAFAIKKGEIGITESDSSISTESAKSIEDTESIEGEKSIEDTENTELIEGINTPENYNVNGIQIKFLYDSNYWETYDLTNAVYKTQAEYEEAVCNYIGKIATLLNKVDWFKQYVGKDYLYIELEIKENDNYILNDYDDIMPRIGYIGSKSALPTKRLIYKMSLTSAMFTHNFVPLVQTLTDLITYNNLDKRSSFSSSLSTGLSQYVQKNLGMDIASCSHGLDIHNYVIEHKKILENDTKIKNILNLPQYKDMFRIGANSCSPGMFGDISINYYWIECCSSFVDYLIQIYGIESVMKMMDGHDESIYYLFNPNGLDGLLSDWNQFLENYPCKMTWDEMDAYINEFKSTHGY